MFSNNNREFYYIQMEKFAREAVNDHRITCKENIVVSKSSKEEEEEEPEEKKLEQYRWEKATYSIEEKRGKKKKICFFILCFQQ